MPLGTRHTLTGTFGWDAHNHMHVLNLSGGGSWHLDMPGQAGHLIGRDVTLKGVRAGFDLIDVYRVLAIDGVPVQQPVALISVFARRRDWSARAG